MSFALPRLSERHAKRVDTSVTSHRPTGLGNIASVARCQRHIKKEQCETNRPLWDEWNRRMLSERETHIERTMEAAVVDAKALAHKLGAPDRLRRHGELVAEVANELALEVSGLGVGLQRGFIQCGAFLHDIGKVLVPEELEQAGTRHEEAGEALLLDNGIEPILARVCRTHARWQGQELTLEELLIALADKLWKGKRVDELELLVIDRVASLLTKNRFDVFFQLDSLFERISASGHENLERSLEAPSF